MLGQTYKRENIIEKCFFSLLFLNDDNGLFIYVQEEYLHEFICATMIDLD
jgi:hypothetical protein